MNRFIVLALVLGAGKLEAGSVFVSSTSPALPVVGPSGLPIAGGEGFVLVGSFDAGFDIGAAFAASDVGAIDAAFNQFGANVEFGSPGGNPPQGFFRKDVSTGISSDSPLVGQQIFLVMGTGSGISVATGLAVARSDQTFQFDNPVFEADVFLGEMDLIVGRLVPVNIDFGGQVFVGDGICTGGFSCVPEPTSGTLAAFAAGGLLLRRRRSAT